MIAVHSGQRLERKVPHTRNHRRRKIIRFKVACMLYIYQLTTCLQSRRKCFNLRVLYKRRWNKRGLISRTFETLQVNESTTTIRTDGSSRWVLPADRTRPALAIFYGRLLSRPWSDGGGAAGGGGGGASWDDAASCSSWRSCAPSSTSCAGSGTRF